MRIKILIPLAALALASCNSEQLVPEYAGDMVPFSVTVSSELKSSGTRVCMDGKALKWVSSDRLGVFDGVNLTAGGSIFTATDTSSDNYVFSGEISAGATGPIYFLYPYQTYTATVGKSSSYTTGLNEGKIFPVEAPYKYATAPNYLPPTTLMLAGKIADKDDSGTVTMKTPLGFVKFTLVADAMHPVTKIQLFSPGSEPLAGTYTLNLTGEDPVIEIQENPSLSSNQQLVSYTITLTPKDAASFAAGDYFIALPPGTYSNGIRMKFWDDSGMIAEKTSANSLTVNRAKIRNLGTVDASALLWYESIDICTLEAVLQKPASSPFNESIPGSFTAGTVYTLTYGPDHDVFKFYSVKAGGYWAQTGVNIFGANSYIEIPGRAGKKIHKIAIHATAQGLKCGNPVLVDTSGPDGAGKYYTMQKDKSFDWLDDTGDNTKKDAWWGNKQYGEYKEWTDFVQEEGQSFRIRCTESADYLKFMDLMVQYVDVDPGVSGGGSVKTVSATPTAMLYSDPVRKAQPCAKDPTVIKLGSMYYLYYSQPPYDVERKPDGINAQVANWHCAVARSSDLINWTRVSDIDLRMSDGTVIGYDAAPCVKVFDGVIHLFYQRVWSGTSENEIWHATSLDGIHFVNVNDEPVFIPSNTWSQNRGIDAEVYRVDDKMILLYVTRDAATETIQQVGMAEAPYGCNYGPGEWTEITTAGPLIAPTYSWEGKCIEAPTVINRDGVWYMFYAGSYNHAYQQIGLATSTDGYHFSRVTTFGDAPGLFWKKGDPESWNSCESGHPGVFEDSDGQVYLFFQGKPTLEGTDSNYSLSSLLISFSD